jgi:hypothetical protein
VAHDCVAHVHGGADACSAAATSPARAGGGGGVAPHALEHTWSGVDSGARLRTTAVSSA